MATSNRRDCDNALPYRVHPRVFLRRHESTRVQVASCRFHSGGSILVFRSVKNREVFPAASMDGFTAVRKTSNDPRPARRQAGGPATRSGRQQQINSTSELSGPSGPHFFVFFKVAICDRFCQTGFSDIA
jgi:hypothetical protein